MTEISQYCILNQPIEVNPTLIFEIRDTWAGLGSAMQRVSTRFQSFADILKDLDIDLILKDSDIDLYEHQDLPGEPVDEPESPKRDDLWGFAEGDRVRVKAVGAHHGLTGKIHWTGGCSIAKFDVTCRDICPNVAFTATHRIADDGTIENVTEGTISCPPADLEHCD